MDGRAWQATIHGVAMSQTQLKQLSMHMLGDAMMLSDSYLRIKFQALLATMQMELKGIMLSEIRDKYCVTVVATCFGKQTHSEGQCR